MRWQKSRIGKWTICNVIVNIVLIVEDQMSATNISTCLREYSSEIVKFIKKILAWEGRLLMSVSRWWFHLLFLFSQVYKLRARKASPAGPTRDDEDHRGCGTLQRPISGKKRTGSTANGTNEYRGRFRWTVAHLWDGNKNCNTSSNRQGKRNAVLYTSYLTQKRKWSR